MKRFMLVASVLAACTFALSLYGRAQTQFYDPTTNSNGVFKEGNIDCQADGKGGDPYLNELKNRDLAPATFTAHTIDEIETTLPQDLPKGRQNDRSSWNPADQQRCEAIEKEGASVEGFLLKMKPEGTEACNCGSTTFHDYHLWLSTTPLPANHGKNVDRSKAMVVEISPRLLGSHKNWKQRTIDHLISNGSKIRISGWLTWDQDHPEQLGNTRATLWEIHPIHKIEVFSNNKWTEL